MKKKYEEAQGLTEEMVRREIRGLVEEAYCIDLFRKGGDSRDELIEMMAKASNMTPQAALRAMNPRLRKGCPSQAARNAHPGHWLAVDPAGHGFLVRFDERRHDPGFEVYRSAPSGSDDDPWRTNGCSYNVSDFLDGLAAWSFWPADDSANKVPWPEKDGVML